MNEWRNDISYYCIFLLFFINYNTLNVSENIERNEIKPRTMFVQRSERNIRLVGWGEGSHKPETNSPNIFFRSLHSHILGLVLIHLYHDMLHSVIAGVGPWAIDPVNRKMAH